MKFVHFYGVFLLFGILDIGINGSIVRFEKLSFRFYEDMNIKSKQLIVNWPNIIKFILIRC